MFQKKDWRAIFIALLSLALFACAGTRLKPLSPDVSVVSVKPTLLSMAEQSFLFTLKVDNPNSFALPINALDFVARFSGKEVAQGAGNYAITVPANGSEIMEVQVNTALLKLQQEFKSLLLSDGLDFDYELAGRVSVDGFVDELPFRVRGNLMEDQ